MAHRRVKISLSPVHAQRLAARMARHGTGRSEEVRRCIDEAEDNHHRLRHDCREHLQAITLAGALIAHTSADPRVREGLGAIEAAVRGIQRLLAPPVCTPARDLPVEPADFSG